MNYLFGDVTGIAIEQDDVGNINVYFMSADGKSRSSSGVPPEYQPIAAHIASVNRHLVLQAQYQPVYKPVVRRTCYCGSSAGNNGSCGPSGCINVPG